MILKRLSFVLLLGVGLLYGIGFVAAQSSTAAQPSDSTTPFHVKVQYADGFKVAYGDGYTRVDVTHPWPGATTTFTYILVPKGGKAPAGIKKATVIHVPITNIVTMSTTYLAELQMLGVADTIIGDNDTKYIYAPAIKKRVDDGKIKNTGGDFSVNVELLISMNPDVIMTQGYGGQWDTYPKLIEAGLPVVINGEWNEKTPLGRAEWIKFIGLFYGKGREATAIFDRIASQYNALVAKVKNVANRPTVFENTPFQGTWAMPGGQSYAARFIEDAGGNYLWKGTSETGSLSLSFEKVFDVAENADFWINTGTWTSMKQAAATDNRFTQFKAYKDGKMYNYVARVNASGGNDYWESGPANPQIVLADLIKILHPDLVPDHKLYYYKLLK